ncbi:MAG: FAD-dependent monooxygenase [Rhizobiaceae bacterium]|nr:FAD-dependent monooxygenase [Rhizobiaceae bacterium]
MRNAPRSIVIAGAGIAGLTAALALSRIGAKVRVFERSPDLREVGAGLQLSPNATRILDRLGVLGRLQGAVRPPGVLLRDVKTLREIARVPLGPAAEQRWGAPYLVVHRADLQQALAAAVAEARNVELLTGRTADQARNRSEGATVRVAPLLPDIEADLVVAADGVWSRLRQNFPGGGAARFAGTIAWRRTIAADAETVRALVPDCVVGAFLHPRFHLICYPIRGGREINLVAFTRGRPAAEDWLTHPDPAPLLACLAGCAPALARFAAEPSGWTAFPLHTVSPEQRWVHGRVVLIGDAAHALTPFAAQGAAMAIEDAATLADCVAHIDGNWAAALSNWEAERRKRVARVRRRGAFNALAWHAAGPVALARNAVLALRSPERLAADLDWLYGWGNSPGT